MPHLNTTLRKMRIEHTSETNAPQYPGHFKILTQINSEGESLKTEPKSHSETLVSRIIEHLPPST